MNIKVINPIPEEDIIAIKEIITNGDFHLYEKIGEGCQGEVYRYKNYAIKVAECMNDAEILKELQDNKLFPKLFFYGEDFMVTEYLEITDAFNYYEKNVDIDLMAEDIYQYCYNKGIIPYDIHDENVVITKNDELKIIDVGAFNFNHINFSLDIILRREEKQIKALNEIIKYVKKPPIAI